MLYLRPDAERLPLVGFLLAAQLIAMSSLHAQTTVPLDDAYQEVAGRLIGAALVDDEGWDKLEHLTTVIGARLSGSTQLEQAITWAIETMRTEGLEGITAQPVKVPNWKRGEESLQVLAPRPRTLPMLGLGGSVGTPPLGIEAPVIVVQSFAELEARDAASVRGKIVVFAVPWEGYGKTVQYRSGGASAAAKKGALAVLVRSATGHSLATPHTGALRYADGAPEIPAAAITVEDAEWFKRLQARGVTPQVRLHMSAQMLPDADSANVIAEIRGAESPNEIVLMGGHFDSWDVGQGAHDDGASCIAAWQALRLIQQLGLRPRRTLRVVLWTNEENGLAGGRAYRDSLGDNVASHVAAIEMDGGAERPVGFGFGWLGHPVDGVDPAYEIARQRLLGIGRLLEAIDAGAVGRGGGGADIGPLMRDGVPGFALSTVGEHYFDWHHTHADTLDKVDPQNLRKAIAVLAVLGYVLADMPGTLTAGS